MDFPINYLLQQWSQYIHRCETQSAMGHVTPRVLTSFKRRISRKIQKKKLLRSLTHLRPLKDFCSGKSQKDPVTVVRFPSIISQGRALLIFWVVMVRPFNPGSPNNGKANPVGTSATLGTSWCGEKNAQKLMLLQMHRCFFGFHSQNFS